MLRLKPTVQSMYQVVTAGPTVGPHLIEILLNRIEKPTLTVVRENVKRAAKLKTVGAFNQNEEE